MSGILIYVPKVRVEHLKGEKEFPIKVLETCGLLDLAKKSSPSVRKSHDGPDDKGQGGFIISWPSIETTEAPVYNPGCQRWAPCKGKDDRAGLFWIGILTDRPFKPETLQRTEMYESIPVKLADGVEWLVPIAKALPHVWGIDDNAEFSRSISPEFAGFSSLCDEYYQVISQKEAGDTIVWSDVWKFCLSALSINYRVNSDILDFLGIINDETGMGIVFASMGLDVARLVVEQQKKTEPVPTPGISGT